MLDSTRLRRLAEESGDRFAVDLGGETIPIQDLEEVVVPGLVVTAVAEAVKQVEEGLVTRHPNRDTLWVVEGFVLDADLIAALPEGVDSADRLLAALTETGRRWAAVHRAPAQPE